MSFWHYDSTHGGTDPSADRRDRTHLHSSVLNARTRPIVLCPSIKKKAHPSIHRNSHQSFTEALRCCSLPPVLVQSRSCKYVAARSIRLHKKKKKGNSCYNLAICDPAGVESNDCRFRGCCENERFFYIPACKSSVDGGIFSDKYRGENTLFRVSLHVGSLLRGTCGKETTVKMSFSSLFASKYLIF